MRESLDAYHEPFKAVVLKHLHALPKDEWRRLRAFAANRSRLGHRQEVGDLTATPKQLIEAGVSEDSISADETLISAFRTQAIEIGTVKGQPVHYVTGQGIYLWGLEPKRGPSLSFWITYPAYPPAW